MKESGEAKPRWVIRDCRDGDEKQILELRQATLGDPRNVQWWNWMNKMALTVRLFIGSLKRRER